MPLKLKQKFNKPNQSLKFEITTQEPNKTLIKRNKRTTKTPLKNSLLCLYSFLEKKNPMRDFKVLQFPNFKCIV